MNRSQVVPPDRTQPKFRKVDEGARVFRVAHERARCVVSRGSEVFDVFLTNSGDVMALPVCSYEGDFVLEEASREGDGAKISRKKNVLPATLALKGENGQCHQEKHWIRRNVAIYKTTSVANDSQCMSWREKGVACGQLKAWGHCRGLS